MNYNIWFVVKIGHPSTSNIHKIQISTMVKFRMIYDIEKTATCDWIFSFHNVILIYFCFLFIFIAKSGSTSLGSITYCPKQGEKIIGHGKMQQSCSISMSIQNGNSLERAIKLFFIPTLVLCAFRIQIQIVIFPYIFRLLGSFQNVFRNFSRSMLVQPLWNIFHPPKCEVLWKSAILVKLWCLWLEHNATLFQQRFLSPTSSVEWI